MKYALLALVSTTAFAVDIPFYIGTYTKPGGSQGIYRATIDSETGKMSEPKLAAESKNPSFLAVDLKGRYVFAANEGAGPTVSAYAVQADGLLKPLNQSSAKGAGPWHLDLRERLLSQARAMGITQLQTSPWCTAHHRDAFFSHRASQGQDGRMVAYMGMLPSGNSTLTPSSSPRNI